MDFERFLNEHGVSFDKHHHTVAYTSQELANVEHVSGYMVAKPVAVKSTSGFVMCVLAAPKRLDLQRVADLLGEADARLATEAEMAEIFKGCELGAEPPVGALFGMKTIMDTQLHEAAFLVMQSGTHTDAVRVSRADWERLCQPEVAPIAVH
jgi:Ala-tRNA(Pro) deacylase